MLIARPWAAFRGPARRVNPRTAQARTPHPEEE